MVIYHPRNNTWCQELVISLFTGLVLSWFLLTGRRMDQGLELQLCAVQKTLAKLLYKLRCEDYFTHVKPHQSVHPTHTVAQT